MKHEILPHWQAEAFLKSQGHGIVVPRTDGSRARCFGPDGSTPCEVCRVERELKALIDEFGTSPLLHKTALSMSYQWLQQNRPATIQLIESAFRLGMSVETTVRIIEMAFSDGEFRDHAINAARWMARR